MPVQCYVEKTPSGMVMLRKENEGIETKWKLYHASVTRNCSVYQPQSSRATVHIRCCNCGQKIDDSNHYHINYFAICSEGCAIDTMQRGNCATRTIHPWGLPVEIQEARYPELKRVRDLIRLNNPNVSFD